MLDLWGEGQKYGTGFTDEVRFGSLLEPQHHFFFFLPQQLKMADLSRGVISCYGGTSVLRFGCT